MIFMSPSVMTWKPIIQGWLIKRSANESATLLPLFERTYDRLYSFVEKESQPKMLFLHAMYARQTCDLLEGLIEDRGDSLEPVHLERLYIFAVMWSLGALMELHDRDAFEHCLRINQVLRRHESADVERE